LGEKNILNHVLVPKHKILSEEEKEKLLTELNISPKQLPKISVNDPAAKAIGAKVGDIVKIIRKSQTAGTAIYYRLVIN